MSSDSHTHALDSNNGEVNTGRSTGDRSVRSTAYPRLITRSSAEPTGGSARTDSNSVSGRSDGSDLGFDSSDFGDVLV